MHHEDRAGVNALIRGIDGRRQDRLPVLTIMCTNRVDAIDPAVRRRAAAVYEFSRPNDEQRRHLLSRSFGGVSINPSDMSLLVKLTRPVDDERDAATWRPQGVAVVDWSDERPAVVDPASLRPVLHGMFTDRTSSVDRPTA